MANKENKLKNEMLPIDPVLAQLPEKMGFKGEPQSNEPSVEPQLGLEQELRLKIMMQAPIDSIESTLEALLQKTLMLAKGFDREDVIELLEKHRPKNKLRPKNS